MVTYCLLRRANRFSIIIIILAFSALSAQQVTGKSSVISDGVPRPTLSGSSTPILDANALAEIQAYVAAAGLTEWNGMQATGTMTYTGAPASLPASLDVLPGNRVKLVITDQHGEDINATNGGFGHIQFAGHPDSPLPAVSVAGGLLPFDMPALVAQSPTSFNVIDGGVVQLADETLHRVTVEISILHRDAGAGSDSRAAIDFYFDPSTHLLKKSATIFMFAGGGLQRFVRVLTYGEYKTSGPLRIPTKISETLDRQATWSLQLTTMNTTTPPAVSLF